MPRIEPVEQCRAGTANMEKPSGTGSETDADFGHNRLLKMFKNQATQPLESTLIANSQKLQNFLVT
jgi:hypothetical protein